MYQRHAAQLLRERYELARSIYIFGPRQSGKTTLARSTFPELQYVNLEDPDTLSYAKRDTRSFLNQFDTGAIIDEPQQFPELFSYLQGQIDIEKKKFVLTSYQNFLSKESISQTLAGRISIVNLFSLTSAEKNDVHPCKTVTEILGTLQNVAMKINLDTLLPSILLGGYPEVCSNPKRAAFWFSDYVATYIERDVRRIINVQDVSLYHRFLKLLSGRVGSNLNRASLSSDSGVSETNIIRWMSVLEDSGIIFQLDPYHQTLNKRLTKAKKVYFYDSGLLCHLLGIQTVEHLKQHPLRGNIIENYVISELKKTYYNNGQNMKLYFWRDHAGHEVDLVIEDNGIVYPIEIKSSQTIRDGLFKSLDKWLDMAGVETGYLFYGGQTVQRDHRIQCLPIGVL